MSIQVAGKAALVFGKNRSHQRSILKQACEKHGWNNAVTRPPSQVTALTEAMKQVARDTGIEPDLPMSLRNLQADLSFEVLRVRKGATRNDWISILSASVDSAHQVSILAAHARTGTTLQSDLQREYDQRRDLMSPSQVRNCVAGVVRRLNGVALGASNLYYIPADSLPTFTAWRDDAALWRYHMVPFEVASDPATVEHIIHQLHDEVTANSQSILDEITTGVDDDKRALLLRKKCQAIIAKIRSYEEALGQQLDWMREPIEAAENGLAVSSLLAVSA